MNDFNSWEEVAAYLQSSEYNAVDVGGVFWYSETHSCCYDDCECEEDYNSVVETLASIQYMCDGLHEVWKR